MERSISLAGLVAMIFCAWLLSAHKFRVRWGTVLTGVALQFALALVVLRTDAGGWFFARLGDFFTLLLDSSDAGAEFVFGKDVFRQHFFAFKVLPTIIFVSSLMSILYYLGIMQVVVKGLARVMQWTMRLSGAESLAAAANVFVGQTEAPLVIKPYVALMTRSELMALMVGGFATIAGGVLAAFAGMGISPAHLVTASVISAPAGLLIAKILQPEVESPRTLGAADVKIENEASNLVEAAAVGASDGLKLALNVAAMLIAFLALIKLFDMGLGYVGAQINAQTGWEFTWSLGNLLGHAFWPLAWIMGIESNDCQAAGQLLGLKMVANEFVAYEKLAEWIKPESEVKLSERTVTIMTYALCGFSNFGSIGIQIGGIGALAPERRSDLAQLGLRAMLGGTLACCMTACVAGVLL